MVACSAHSLYFEWDGIIMKLSQQRTCLFSSDVFLGVSAATPTLPHSYRGRGIWFFKQDFWPRVLNPLTAKWALRALLDFTLASARRFYSSMGNPLAGKGLQRQKLPINSLTAEWALRALIDFTRQKLPINSLTAEWALRALIDFTRQWGTPWAGKG